MLYELTLAVYPKRTTEQRSIIAFLAATLHILSPAGMFLSAPYAESSFSLLNFTGFYLYANASTEQPRGSQLLKDCSITFCGVAFGIATTFRGNGIFSGLVLVYDAITSLIDLLKGVEVVCNIRRLVVVTFSGIIMACIALVPQYLAYVEYCCIADETRRPWCAGWIPSVYAWVQKEYWWVTF